MEKLESLLQIQKKIQAACASVNRQAEEVMLVGVSKTFEASAIQRVYGAGLRDFGESRVQEFLKKKENLPGDIRWHMIGRLQTNKVKDVLGKTVLIHSLDRYDLLKKIDRDARAQKIQSVECLLQVNVSGEKTKGGISPEAIGYFLEQIPKDSPVRIKGLMVMGPLTEDRGETRRVFRKAAQIFKALKEEGRVEMKHLSMGMSGDFEIAVEEGSTMVRIGSALFGQRGA